MSEEQAGSSRASTESEIARLFDGFIEVFATFDSSAVGRFFSTPGVALRRDGALRGFSASKDVEAYYQEALDRYRAAGCSACRYSELDIDALSETCAVAKVTWDLMRGDGSVLSRWRQAYFLSRTAGQWRIFGSAFMSD